MGNFKRVVVGLAFSYEDVSPSPVTATVYVLRYLMGLAFISHHSIQILFNCHACFCHQIE